MIFATIFAARLSRFWLLPAPTCGIANIPDGIHSRAIFSARVWGPVLLKPFCRLAAMLIQTRAAAALQPRFFKMKIHVRATIEFGSQGSGAGQMSTPRTVGFGFVSQKRDPPGPNSPDDFLFTRVAKARVVCGIVSAESFRPSRGRPSF